MRWWRGGGPERDMSHRHRGGIFHFGWAPGNRAPLEHVRGANLKTNQREANEKTLNNKPPAELGQINQACRLFAV